jgi:hypothetical protein
MLSESSNVHCDLSQGVEITRFKVSSRTNISSRKAGLSDFSFHLLYHSAWGGGEKGPHLLASEETFNR